MVDLHWKFTAQEAIQLIDQLAPAFGLTGADVDALFKSKPEYPLLGP